MDAATAWAEAMKFENRPNPYPFFEELRKTPVAKVADKTYVVTGYRGSCSRWRTIRGSAPTSAAARSGLARLKRKPDLGAEHSRPTAASRASSCPTRPTTTGRAGR